MYFVIKCLQSQLELQNRACTVKHFGLTRSRLLWQASKLVLLMDTVLGPTVLPWRWAKQGCRLVGCTCFIFIKGTYNQSQVVSKLLF